ncbi:MAG TPA: hypothetical protein PL029_09770, partial [Bacteroidia bacterium]|nr:hypothetical protein [Bacteroidia bacterium]
MKRSLSLYLIVFSLCCYGQYEPLARNAFINQPMQEAFDYWNISRPNTTFHSSFKPYLSGTFANATDSAVPFRFYAFKNFFLSKTLNEKPQKPDWYNVQVHPILDAEIGYDGILKKPLFSTIGGTHVKLNINNDFTFAASLFGGKTTTPFFLDTSISGNKILPAYGQAYGKNAGEY